MQTRVFYDLEGLGRFGGRPSGASFDVLCTGAGAAWQAVGATRADLTGEWMGPELEGALTAAGWSVTQRPRQPRRLVFVGELRAVAVAHHRDAIGLLLAVAGEADLPLMRLELRFQRASPGAPEVTLVLADEADVLEVCAEGPGSAPAVALIKDAMERAGAAAGLRVRERPA